MLDGVVYECSESSAGRRCKLIYAHEAAHEYLDGLKSQPYTPKCLECEELNPLECEECGACMCKAVQCQAVHYQDCPDTVEDRR